MRLLHRLPLPALLLVASMGCEDNTTPLAPPTGAAPAALPAPARAEPATDDLARTKLTTLAGDVWVAHESGQEVAVRTSEDGTEAIDNLLMPGSGDAPHRVTVRVYPNRHPFTAGTDPRVVDPRENADGNSVHFERLDEGSLNCMSEEGRVTCEAARLRDGFLIVALVSTRLETWNRDRDALVAMMRVQGVAP